MRSPSPDLRIMATPALRNPFEEAGAMILVGEAGTLTIFVAYGIHKKPIEELVGKRHHVQVVDADGGQLGIVGGGPQLEPVVVQGAGRDSFPSC